MSTAVGFIGLGIMGRATATNLAKTQPVVAHDLDPERVAGIDGVEPVESVQAVGQRCETVFMSLPSSAIVESVVTGSNGLLEHLTPGAMIVDLSTTMPTVSQGLARAAEAHGVDFVDAPVSGGEAGAIEASLSVMVGASPEAFERALPYLRTIGGTVARMGPVGSGGVAKLVNNMIVGSEFAVIAEAFALADRFGLDPSTLYEVLRGGWAGSRVLDVSAPAMISGDYRPGGTVDLLEKDLGYARGIATEKRVPVPLTAITHEILIAAQARGDGKASQPVILELWNDLTRTRMSETERGK